MAQASFWGVRPTLVGGAFVSTPAALDRGTLTIKPVRLRIRQYSFAAPSGVVGSGTASGWVGWPGHAVGS